MRFYTSQHPFYCGIDLHARTMYVCVLSQDGEVMLRRGMLPQAYGYPAERRATRDLLRRRLPLTRRRATLLAHIQNTHSQYPLPEIGQQLAYKGNRDGVAERFLAPAVQQSVEGDLALIVAVRSTGAQHEFWW